MWIGIQNYQQLVADPTFWKALTNSIVYLLVTPTIIALSVGLAIIVNRKLRGVSIFRALYFVPAVSGSIAIGIAWRWLFDRNGFINSVLISIGALKTPIQWLSEPSLVLPIAMLLTIWAGIGYYSVIFVAGLQNIPEELYDAAQIDGCNSLQKHWHVSLPGLRPQIVFVSVIANGLDSVHVAPLIGALKSTRTPGEGRPLESKTIARSATLARGQAGRPILQFSSHEETRFFLPSTDWCE